jgi:hypothetical protein
VPWVNGRFYANPAYGRAVERARAVEGTPNGQGSGAHWVTINGRHVLIQEGSAQLHPRRVRDQQAAAPKNSRDDLVLIPGGSGKPEANVDLNGFWTMTWTPRELKGLLVPPGSKYSNASVKLTESVNDGSFESAGDQKGGFRDIISPESRKITQQFSIDGKRVQVVLGRDRKGNLIRAWDVKVTVKYPNAPTYSPGP